MVIEEKIYKCGLCKRNHYGNKERAEKCPSTQWCKEETAFWKWYELQGLNAAHYCGNCYNAARRAFKSEMEKAGKKIEAGKYDEYTRFLHFRPYK
jgi:hypothetical protein